MTTAAVTAEASTVRDFVTLLKPGVMSLVVFTGAAGMMVAPGHIQPLQQFITLLCIALGSGAGAAMNMWFDRDIDAIMTRTKKRPIPAGRVAPDDALAFGLFMALLSVSLMDLAVNGLAALILGVAIAFYVLVYTMWLKRSTPQNIVIGGAAGAFPPMIGWAAVTGNLSLEPLLLFGIIFLWTPPHFWALALYKSGDYARAGVPMMPVVAGAASTKRQMLFYTYLLVAITLILPVLHMTGMTYTISCAMLGGLFLFHVHKVLRDPTDNWPRKTFRFSILYLFLLFTLLVVDNFSAHLFNAH